MIEVLIIEDEKPAAEWLSKQLRNIGDYKTLTILDSIATSVKWLQSNKAPELIFLDIQLADGLSFNIFNQVKINSFIIFTTAYDEYAMKAFEYNSVDYILKPITEASLIKALDKYSLVSKNNLKANYEILIQELMNKISQLGNYRNRFLIPKGDALIPIKSDEIAYFYTEEKEVVLVTHTNQKYFISYSLDNLEESLDPKIFFRINRQFIVSINSIKKLHNYFNYKLLLEIQPISEKEILVSRSKINDFKEWLNK